MRYIAALALVIALTGCASPAHVVEGNFIALKAASRVADPLYAKRCEAEARSKCKTNPCPSLEACQADRARFNKLIITGHLAVAHALGVIAAGGNVDALLVELASTVADITARISVLRRAF